MANLEHLDTGITLIGFMNSGKTTVGRLVSEICGLEFVDTDDLFELKHGIPAGDVVKRYGTVAFMEMQFAGGRASATL